jgi:hypothetical protein
MDNDSIRNNTTFDDLIQDREVQMIKAAIPYIGNNSQKGMAIMVKFMELQKTMEMFENNMEAMEICSIEETDEPRHIQMLQSIRPFCTEQEQTTIDMLINYEQMFSAYGTIFN